MLIFKMKFSIRRILTEEETTLRGYKFITNLPVAPAYPQTTDTELVSSDLVTYILEQLAVLLRIVNTVRGYLLC